MKLIIFFLFCSCLSAQIRTANLVRQWDMQTVTGGTTLVDLSGNGNDGTLVNAPTVGALGITFNGTNQLVSGAALINNLNFTVIVCGAAASSTGAGGFMFAESDAAITFNEWILLHPADSRVAGQNPLAVPTIDLKNDWHCYTLRRDNNTVIFWSPDLNRRRNGNLAGATVTTGFQTGVGAIAGTSPGSFFAGTIGYLLEYTSALPDSDIVSAISTIKTTMATRGAPMYDIVTPLYPQGVWHRAGAVINNTGSANYIEPSVLYTTTDCQVVANPCFQMWASNASSGTSYLEAINAIGPWVLSGQVIASKPRPAALKVGSTYYVYVDNATGGIDLYTGSAPNSLTLNTAAVVAKGGGGTWDSTQIWQKTVINVDSTHWYMIYDATGTGHSGFTFGGATSSDGVAWSKVATNPLAGWESTDQPCDGWLAYVNGKFYYWHSVFLTAPYNTVTARRSSTSFSGLWAPSSPGAYFNITFAGSNGLPTFASQDTPDEVGQIADQRLIEVNGITYMFYVGYASGDTLKSMKLAIANMPLSQLVLTGEGEATDLP